MAIPLRSSKEYRSANSLDLSWLSRRWLFNIPRSGQVDGIRPLGRLALCDHRKQVESKLVHLIERAMQPEVREATAKLCGLPVDDAGVDVYIVGATSAGTGSGAIADIGLMIRQIVRAKAFNDVEIHGVLVHGTGAMRNVTDMQEANTACLLKELRHLATPGLGTDRGFSKTDDQRDDSPFDNTLFVHIGDGLNGHGFATGIREVGKFLFDSSATAAQFDFRQWRNEHGDEFSPDDQLRLIGIGLQDAETFRLASAQSKDLSALLLRSWCDFMAPQSDAEASKLPVELSDSQTLLTELRLTNETLPQQVMSLLRGTTGREIEAFATGLNDQLLTFGDPNTVSRGEVMDFLSREISKSTKPEGNQYSLHQIVFGVQATLTGNTRNCEQAIQSHLYQLIDLPHRLESAVAAAGFTRTTLKQTTRSCTELLREIEHTFSSLALEADPDERLGNGENAESAIRTFCQQYCVLLAYQTIYQCFLNHVSAVTDFVNSSIQELTSLRDQLAAAAAELSPTAVVSDDVLPQTIDEFDSHLRISTPQLLADFLRSARDVKNLSSNLVDAATRFLLSADPDSEGTAAIADPVNFPANAWPVLTVTGGRRRVLGLVPEGIGSSAWETKLKAEFGDCAAVRNIEDNEITVICEISGVSIDNVFGCLTHENPHLVDVASRIHTRNDIEW